MLPFSQYLDFRVPLLNDNVDPFKFHKVRHVQYKTDILNPKFIKILSDLSLKITMVQMFYAAPGFSGIIHEDSPYGDINKINWIFRGKGSRTNWYCVKPGVPSKPPLRSIANTGYKVYQPDEVDLLYSIETPYTTLIHAGYPHNASNADEDRWCISVSYNFVHNDERPTMNQALELFKDYLIPE
jgi:hypothetical protein